MPARVLLVTGGHPFVREAFLDVFDALDREGVCTYEHVEQPGATGCIAAISADAIDVLVLYDMPGLRFTGDRGNPVEFDAPPTDFIDGLYRLLAAGVGVVVLHHAVASWPAWSEWAELVGARFHYQPAVLRGVSYPDSGYVFNVTHRIDVLEPAHPICAGLGDSFVLTDELYCFPVFEEDVTPLFRTDFQTEDSSQFFSADLAIRGTRNSNVGWSHRPGSPLVGWVKPARGAPLAYLQFGDGPATYADPMFRRVLANAIAWSGSESARQWAQTTRTTQPTQTTRPGVL